jgi:hypothetical protein
VKLSGGGCSTPVGLLELFEDAKPLANQIGNYQFEGIVFPTATTLYGYYSGELTEVTISSTGGKLGKQWSGVVEGSDIQYAAGLIYGNAGQVFNAGTGSLLGTFDVGNQGCCNGNQLLPDAPINRAFAVGITPFFGSFGITSYNLSEFTPIAVTSLAQLSGNTRPTLLRWGSDGLAFIITSGCCGNNASQVVLVQSPGMLLTAGTGSNPAPTLTSLAPASAEHGSGNLTVTIDGTGFVPASEVTWSGKPITVEYLSATQLQISVPASDFASAGTANVVVTNPVPSGGSTTGHFTIN